MVTHNLTKIDTLHQPLADQAHIVMEFDRGCATLSTELKPRDIRGRAVTADSVTSLADDLLGGNDRRASRDSSTLGLDQDASIPGNYTDFVGCFPLDHAASDGEWWSWATQHQPGGIVPTNHQLLITPLENRIDTTTSSVPSAAREVAQVYFPTACPGHNLEDQLFTAILDYDRNLALEIPQDIASLQAMFEYQDGLTSASSATTSESPLDLQLAEQGGSSSYGDVVISKEPDVLQLGGSCLTTSSGSAFSFSLGLTASILDPQAPSMEPDGITAQNCLNVGTIGSYPTAPQEYGSQTISNRPYPTHKFLRDSFRQISPLQKFSHTKHPLRDPFLAHSQPQQTALEGELNSDFCFKLPRQTSPSVDSPSRGDADQRPQQSPLVSPLENVETPTADQRSGPPNDATNSVYIPHDKSREKGYQHLGRAESAASAATIPPAWSRNARLHRVRHPEAPHSVTRPDDLPRAKIRKLQHSTEPDYVPGMEELMVTFDINPEMRDSKVERKALSIERREKVKSVRDIGACSYCRNRKTEVSLERSHLSVLKYVC
jgi:hypothetical protein